jgi:hypothetical protein
VCGQPQQLAQLWLVPQREDELALVDLTIEVTVDAVEQLAQVLKIMTVLMTVLIVASSSAHSFLGRAEL